MSTWTAIEMLVTAARGALLTPWHYLPFVGHYLVVLGIGAWLNSDRSHRIVSWWLLVTILLWSFTVRDSLSTVS